MGRQAKATGLGSIEVRHQGLSAIDKLSRSAVENFARAMEQVLVLNSTYEPLQVISWKKGIRMLCQEKVEVIAEYDREIRSFSWSIRLPSVLRLVRYVRVRRHHYQVKFTRNNLYSRDGFRCQYCGNSFPPGQLTYDHVIPVARGGSKNWENIVTCCVGCNRAKADRTPEESGLRPLKKPKAPYGFPQRVRYLLWGSRAPESWQNYIFWSP